jgi:hypothetical protein
MLTFSQPQVAPEPDSEPDSPDLIPHFSLTDPFSTTVNEMDETIEVQLSNDPEFSIVIPRRNLAESEVVEILRTAITALLQAKEAQTKREFEEMDSKLKSREKDLIGEGYEKGLRSAYLMCTTLQGKALADSDPVKDQPGIPTVIIDYLANRTKDKNAPPEDDHSWDIPKFEGVDDVLASMDGNLIKALGKYEGVVVHVITTGQVATDATDEDGFFGKCTVTVPDNTMNGYVVGHLQGCGTTVIIGADDCLYLYTPHHALDREWAPMDGSRGATLQVADGQITFSKQPDLDVVSLSEW